MLSAILFFLGCGGDGKGPKLGYVTGKVTLNGEPLVGASVRIEPENGAPSLGFVGKDGRYVMEYKTDKPGAPVGTFPIYVTVMAPRPDIVPDMDPAEEAKLRQEAVAKTGIPKEWRDGSTKITVKPGSNVFDIEMEREASK